MEVSQATREKFGFKFGRSGAHSARSMMLAELQQLFEFMEPGAGQAEYQQAIVEFNRLNKPTDKARKLTYRHLVDLYGMSPEVPLFRVMRRLWPLESEAQPILALQSALARDPLLRLSMPFITSTKSGEAVSREQVEEILKRQDPDRFSPASLKSFAQNINGSWTQAGFLKGKAKKVRVDPAISPINIAFALFLGYLEGATGERLLHSAWCQLLTSDGHRLQELATASSHRGIIDFRQSGGVTEVRFPGFLTAEEEGWLHE